MDMLLHNNVRPLRQPFISSEQHADAPEFSAESNLDYFPNPNCLNALNGQEAPPEGVAYDNNMES